MRSDLNDYERGFIKSVSRQRKLSRLTAGAPCSVVHAIPPGGAMRDLFDASEVRKALLSIDLPGSSV